MLHGDSESRRFFAADSQVYADQFTKSNFTCCIKLTFDVREFLELISHIVSVLLYFSRCQMNKCNVSVFQYYNKFPFFYRY